MKVDAAVSLDVYWYAHSRVGLRIRESMEAQRSMFGVRLRVWTNKGLTTDESQLSFKIFENEVLLLREDRENLRKPGWIIFKSEGFDSQDTALQFGQRLAFAVQVSSIRRFWGADIGHDRVTAGLFRPMREALEAQGHILRDNVHGLDVYPSRPETYWLGLTMKGVVSTNPLPLISDIQTLAAGNPDLPAKLADAIRVWNEAMICNEPIAQALLAITSVETLAQGSDWSKGRLTAIGKIEVFTESLSDITDSEREEVKYSVERMHRFGVNQSIRRLLQELHIFDIWSVCDVTP